MNEQTLLVPRKIRSLPLEPFFDAAWLRHLLLSTQLVPTGVQSARIHYARIKEDGCVLLGISGVDEAGGGLFLSATLDESDRLRAEYAQIEDRDPTACVLRSNPMVLLRSFAHDRKLTALPRLLDMNWVRRKLQADPTVLERRWRVRRRKSELRWLRYKPERRAVGRLDLSVADDSLGQKTRRTFFIRCRHAGNQAIPQWVMGAAQEAKLLAPRALATLGHGISVESKVEGIPVDSSPSFVGSVQGAGVWLARFHGLKPCPVQPMASTFVAHRCANVARELANLDPAAGRWAEELVERLNACAPSATAAQQLHGDFHHGQLLDGPEGVGVVDLDRVCLGDPAFDMAVFYAHLVEDFPHLAQLMQRALLEGYAEVASLPSEEVRRWFECVVLLIEAGAGFRRAEIDWASRLHRKLELVEAGLLAMESGA